VETDLAGLVADVVETVQQRADEAGVTIRREVPEELPPVMLDPEAMSRAVLNVVTNAVDAAEERPDGVVTIRAAVDAAATLVRITVADNGPGMSAETLAEIFNLFVSTKGSRGTGLGLTVSRKILHEHGGDIHAASVEGEGSTFTLELPLRLPGDAPAPGSDVAM
jgi:signal transduction histidine kinase